MSFHLLKSGDRRFNVLLSILLPLSLYACGDDQPAQPPEAAPCVLDEANPCGPVSGTVSRVIDGDTIELDSGERIRYLMVDTPEMSDPPECFAEQAQTLNQQLTQGKKVYLEYDPSDYSEGCKGYYGRLLAYVCIDGQMVNQVLLERGYAEFYQYSSERDEKYYEQLKAAEQTAKDNQAGLWGSCQ